MLIMKIRKYFMNPVKEEKWINQMLKEGKELVYSTGSTYYFIEESNPNVIIKSDYRYFKSQNDFLDYLLMFEDSGWMHVKGTKYSGVQYFKKINGFEAEDIFSDAPSKAAKYKRMADMWLTLVLSFIPIGIVFINNGYIKLRAFLYPKELYYTPGLWNMTGARFWKAFMFETPFAMGRGFLWLVFPALILIYGYFYFKLHRVYKREKNIC